VQKTRYRPARRPPISHLFCESGTLYE
jgi:hypothetical protein